MRRIGLVTCRELPDLDGGDRPLLDALRSSGVRADPLVWDDPGVDWAAADALILRSCWDYPARFDAFTTWLDRLEALGALVFNPLETVRWNLDKRYLLELEERGIPIVPTRALQGLEIGGLAALAAAEDWPEIVIKPSVGANAVGLVRVATADAERLLAVERSLMARPDRERTGAAVLVQPLVPGIAEGEWSLVFVGGTYSHAAVKRPASGDFRTQPHLGGTWTPASPPSEVRACGDAVIAALDRPWVYARVDVVPTPEAVLLMELELIEPSLLFDMRPSAAERLAALVLGGS